MTYLEKESEINRWKTRLDWNIGVLLSPFNKDVFAYFILDLIFYRPWLRVVITRRTT